MKTKILWRLPAVVLVLCSAAWADAEKASVRFGIPPGKYVMTTTSRSEGTITIAGVKTPTKDQTRYVWQLDVPKPDEKSEKKIALRLTEVKTEGEQQGQTYRYDSTGQAEPKGEHAFDFVYGALLEASVFVTLDADDSVLESSGLDKLWAGLADKAQTDGQKAILAAMKLSLNDKAMEAGFRRLEALMPKKTVAIGDLWKSGLRIDLPMIGELKARYDCKLVAWEKDGDGKLAMITADCNYTLANAKTSQIEGLTLTLNKADVDEKITLKVQLKTGLVVFDECRRATRVEAQVAKDGQQQEFVSEGTVHSTTTVIAGDAAKPGALKLAPAAAGGSPGAASSPSPPKP